MSPQEEKLLAQLVDEQDRERLTELEIDHLALLDEQRQEARLLKQNTNYHE